MPGRRTRRRSFACSGPATARRAWCSASGARGRRGCGTAGCARAGRGGGGLRLHRPGARPRRQRGQGSRGGPDRAHRPARHRGVGPAAHASRPAVGGSRRGARPARGRALRPLVRVRPLAPRRATAGEAGRAHRRALPGPDPATARTGVYLVRVRAGDRRAVWPVAVAGLPGRRAGGRPRPLVVLPVLTWQGLNPVDDDLDGFADTFPSARRVHLDREFAGGALPPGFRSASAPLLRFLDRARLAYDLTTDLSLARGEGPALGNAPGVAIAGSAVWLPASLEGGCATTWRTAGGSPPSARTPCAATPGSAEMSSGRPRRRGRRTCSASGPASCAPARRRSACPRTSSACSTASAA